MDPFRVTMQLTTWSIKITIMIVRGLWMLVSWGIASQRRNAEPPPNPAYEAARQREAQARYDAQYQADEWARIAAHNGWTTSPPPVA